MQSGLQTGAACTLIELWLNAKRHVVNAQFRSEADRLHRFISLQRCSAPH